MSESSPPEEAPSCRCCGQRAEQHGLMCQHVVHRRLLTYTTAGDGVVPDTSCSACNLVVGREDLDAEARHETLGLHVVCASCWAERTAWNVHVGASDYERGYALIPRARFRLAKGLEPHEANRVKLDLGVYAKLSFSTVPNQPESWAEHMWVEVVALGEGVFAGQLDNDPGVFAPEVLEAGDQVSFASEHVIESRFYAKPPQPPPHDCPRCSLARYDERRDPEQEDPQLETKRRLIETVGRCGWHMLMISGDEGETPFTYTVGLQHTYAHPELIVYGLDGRFAGDVLNHLGNRVHSGTRLRAGQQLDDLLEGYEVHLRSVSPKENDLGFAWWYYGPGQFEALELVLVRS